jgi:hypothetical protein
MSSYPARIPASVFANPSCQTPAFKTKTFTPPRPTYNSPSPYPVKSRLYSTASDDVYVPRSSSFMSIAYLREAITTIDTKMSALVKERTDLETKLELAVRLQSPVLRLPSELLSRIFSIGVLEMGDENPIMVPTLMLVW